MLIIFIMGKHHSSDYKLAAVNYYMNNNKIGIRQIRKIFKLMVGILCLYYFFKK